MVLSPAGSAAILYYKSAAAVQVVSGLPNWMQAGPQLDSSALPQAPDVFAISDDAAVVLAGVAENAKDEAPRGEVFVVPQDGSAPRSIGPVQHASAMAFFKKSHDLVVADDAASAVVMVSDAGGASAPAWMFTDPGLQAPDSVQVAPDNKSLLSGSSHNQVLAMMDASGANAVFVSCVCTPTEVRPLSVAAIYQITEARSGLLWILDSNPLNPRVLFVPVPSEGDPAATGNGPQ